MKSEATLKLMQRADSANDKPEQILLNLQQLIDEGVISRKEIEKFSTYSPSVISQILNNKYTGDADGVTKRLVSFYKVWIAKNTVVKTDIVEQMHHWMDVAWKRRWMIRLNGRFGGGKSKAAHLYCATHDYAVFVALSKNESIGSILHKIADAMNISSLTGSVQDKLGSITRHMKRPNNNAMLVFDEADELNKNTLAVLRYLWDENDDYCAIVLLTTSRFDALLQHPDLGYLQSRIAITKDIPEFKKSEIKKIVDNWDHKISNEMMEKICAWVLNNFAGRSIYFLMSTAQTFAQMNDKKKIDDESVEEAMTVQSTRAK